MNKPASFNQYDGVGPDGPHLLLYTNATFTVATAVPPGAMMGLKMKASEPHIMQRMVLQKVTPRQLIFKCGCNPQCTAVYTYRLTETGRHGR